MAEQQYPEQDQHAQQAALRLPLSTRPRILERTHSSPTTTAKYADAQGQSHEQSWQGSLTGAAPQTSALQGLGIDTETRSNGFLQTNNDAEHEVNIAVVGAVGVGKSSFIQQSLGLSSRPTTAVTSCRINLDSAAFLVRMLECQLQDVIIETDNKISWPTDPRMPTVDAACTLYDISNKDSFEDVPVVLNALEKASIPSLLVSNKCDRDDRQLDPNNTEQRAKAILRSLHTLQSSTSHVDSHTRGIASLLRAVSGKSLPLLSSFTRPPLPHKQVVFVKTDSLLS
ncbi:ras GEF, partial [Aureobasidium melanogenum]